MTKLILENKAKTKTATRSEKMFESIVRFPFDPDKFAQQMEAMEEHSKNYAQASGAAPQSVPKADEKPARNTDNAAVPRAAQSGNSSSLNEND
jgi:hypothetical protein